MLEGESGTKRKENINSKGRKVGRYMSRKRGKTGAIEQKHGRFKKDKSVSMGTLSMKIFKAAILLLHSDFFINPYLSPPWLYYGFTEA